MCSVAHSEDEGAGRELEKLIDAAVDESLWYKSALETKNDPLFHYTNAAGLLGIVQTHRLWATHLRYLNDSSEMDYSTPLIRAAVAERFDLDTADQFIQGLQDFDEHTGHYVVCFSDGGDLLSQWRHYAESGGYAIGFDYQRFQAELPEGAVLRRVVYEPDAQQGIIADLLDRVARVVPPRPDRPFDHPDHEQWRKTLAHAFARLYSEFFFMRAYFKFRAFSDEREWRLLAVLDHRKKLDIGLRALRNMVVPYITYPPSDDQSLRLPITTIVHGPTANPRWAESLLTFPLRHLGYRGVDIKRSEIPLRF